MKIAFLTPEYPHKRLLMAAGLGTSIKSLATELVKQGVEVSVFVYGQKSSSEFIDEEIQIYQIAHKKYSIGGWYLHRKYLQNYINKIIIKKNIMLLEAPDWGGITAFMQLKCPVLIRLHGSDTYFCHLEERSQKRKNYIFEKLALKSANAIVSVSGFTANITRELFKLKTEIKVIHNGVQGLMNTENDTRPKNNSILYFGSIIRKKGVLELADIFNEVVTQQPTATLTLLGRDVKDVRTRSSTLKLFYEGLHDAAKKNVKHVPHVPYQEVKQYIYTASVVVLPSFAEAFPMTWLEAMYMEKALVTSNIGWANEIMIDGETGYVEDPKKNKAYAEKILRLLKDQDLNIQFGQNAKKRIEENFMIDRIARKNIELYKSLTRSV